MLYLCCVRNFSIEDAFKILEKRDLEWSKTHKPTWDSPTDRIMGTNEDFGMSDFWFKGVTKINCLFEYAESKDAENRYASDEIVSLLALSLYDDITVDLICSDEWNSMLCAKLIQAYFEGNKCITINPHIAHINGLNSDNILIDDVVESIDNYEESDMLVVSGANKYILPTLLCCKGKRKCFLDNKDKLIFLP